jgi:RimJ/RimL family protein N-acetyltransferase
MTSIDQSADLKAGRSIRPAAPADIPMIRAYLAEAIDSSPFYNDAFKAHEKARFSADFLLALISADPWYVPIIHYKGEVAGFGISTPEFGVLWATWIYISPKFRRTGIALAAIGMLVRRWDNGRFHKISCYVRSDNTRSEAVMAHFGFVRTALLRAHLFGQDYWLMERPLNKTVAGYADDIRLGRLRLMKLRLRHLLAAKAATSSY